jgi:hypothetical protein
MSEEKTHHRIKHLYVGMPSVNLLIQDEQNISPGSLPKEIKDHEDHFGDVYKTSTFMCFTHSDYREPTTDELDDYAATGYTSLGLPFHINVDGFHTTDNPDEIAQFTRDEIIPLMDVYAERLSTESDPKYIIKHLIRDIEKARKNKITKNQNLKSILQFTLSLGIGYQKGDQLRYAGFGIGDTGLVLKHQNQIHSLTYRNVPKNANHAGHKDGFDEWLQKDWKNIIFRNDLFDTPVEPGDESFGYTSVLWGTGIESDPQETKIVQKFGLNQNLSFKSKDGLLPTVFAKNRENYKTLLTKSSEESEESKAIVQKLDTEYINTKDSLGEKHKSTQNLRTQLNNLPNLKIIHGDDCTMSSIRFPAKEKQQQIQNEMVTEITKKIEELRTYALTEI